MNKAAINDPPPMSLQYEFRLSPMSMARSRAGAPGEMIPYHALPANDDEDDILFVFRDGVASFEVMKEEDKNLKPSGTQAWFFARGPLLMLEPYANNVYVESPLSKDLPSGFDRTPIPSCDTSPKVRRHIYLRHGDTIHFQDLSCAIRISVMRATRSTITSFAEGVNVATVADIQVKSSAHERITAGSGATLPEDEDTEDEDDLDGQIDTPLGGDDLTPATSRPTDGFAVQETPRPNSRESNNLYSTAQDKPDSPDFIGDSINADDGTPAARAGAGAGRDKRAKAKTSQAGDSQYIFHDTKGQRTYGGTPKLKRQAKHEDQESPSKSDLPAEPLNDPLNLAEVDDDAAISKSSPKRKRPLADTVDQDDDAKIPSTEPAPKKRGPGRPPKGDKTPQPQPTKSAKGRGRPSKDSKVSEARNGKDEAAESFPNSGKLKRPARQSTTEEDASDEVSVVVPQRKPIPSPDLDPSARSTPQSSATPLSGKPPAKVLLSRSTFADDTKTKNWLKKHGASVDEKIPGKRSSFVCIVAKGELTKTPKMLQSLALGKKVVTDQWLEDCMEQDQLLDLDAYVHDDLAEIEHIDRSKLFAGKVLFITTALAKRYGDLFTDMKDLATAVGALRVESGAAKKASNLWNPSTIFLGDDLDDQDAKTLGQEQGRTVYQKDLIRESIFRGELLTSDDTFKWKAQSAKGKKGKK